MATLHSFPDRWNARSATDGWANLPTLPDEPVRPGLVARLLARLARILG